MTIQRARPGFDAGSGGAVIASDFDSTFVVTVMDLRWNFSRLWGGPAYLFQSRTATAVVNAVAVGS